MGSVPKVVAIRADLVLQAVGSEENHQFVTATFDEGVFLFDYESKDAAAVLSIKLSFAKDKEQDVDSGDWYSQMYAPDDAIADLVVKEYTFTPGSISTFLFALSIPLMDKSTRVTVSEVSGTKGDLKIDGVGTSIG